MEFRTITFEELRKAYYALIWDFCKVGDELKKFKDDKEFLSHFKIITGQLKELLAYIDTLHEKQLLSDGLIRKR